MKIEVKKGKPKENKNELNLEKKILDLEKRLKVLESKVQ